MITAWDPGDMTGWAVFDDKGNVKEIGECPLDYIEEQWDHLEATYGRITVVIVEDYRLFKKRAIQQSGSRMPAARGIGSLTTMAKRNKAKLIVQPSSIKDSALKSSGIKMPSNHAETHKWDAYLHGYHYLVTNRIIVTPLMKEKGVTW